MSTAGHAHKSARRRPCPGVNLHLYSIGPAPVRRVMRPHDSWVIGSSSKADVVLAGPMVADHHCRIHHHGDRLELEDLDSAVGVRISGARVRWAELPLMGSFELGSTTVCTRPAAGPEPLLAGMVGDSPLMHQLCLLITRVARTSLPVLLRGETGTGKELAARAIHEQSPRSARPLIAVNGATVTSALGLSLLFGHVAGSYTGATHDRRGAFREADGGTLFIDELAALPAEAQAALLRVLEEGLVSPIGSDRVTRVDVRLVAASCEPLEQLTRSGGFRLDLYQRLASCVIELPPLRDRPVDIAPIAHHLLAHSELAGCRIDSDALSMLRNDPLPGNVRELRNILFDAALRCQGRTIQASDVALVLAARRNERAAVAPQSARQLLERTGGNISLAARHAGMARSSFRDLLRKCPREPPS